MKPLDFYLNHTITNSGYNATNDSQDWLNNTADKWLHLSTTEKEAALKHAQPPPIVVHKSAKFTLSKDLRVVNWDFSWDVFKQEASVPMPLCVVRPKSDLLILNLKTVEQVAAFEEAIKLVTEASPNLVKSVHRASVNGDTHVYVKLTRSLKELTRIGLQAVLGSDPKKEVHALASSLGSLPDANVLAVPKLEYDRLTLEGVF